VIHHIALPTVDADVSAEVAFWALLGFTPVDPPESLRDRATWVQAPGGTQIHLMYTSEPAHAGHVAVVAPEFSTTITSLEASGFSPEPRTPHWGAPRAYVRSPGGHLVELMAASPSIK
jgi:catechol 2,3-dioxygenase-like lactoylglutathione lyase family enzyme